MFTSVFFLFIFLLYSQFSHSQPERIDPQRAKGYDVRSDVWSLGITLMEVATGRFPYPKWGSVFEQLYQVKYVISSIKIDKIFEIINSFKVVQGEAPRITSSYNGIEFSDEFVDFVNTWLVLNAFINIILIAFIVNFLNFTFQFNKRRKSSSKI